jgi:hypothetical protein
MVMPGDLVFASTFQNNSVVILDCLGAGDQQNGRWLEESINDISTALGRPGYCTRKRVSSYVQLVAELKVIEQNCKMGITKPVLHFEGHGDPVRGLLMSGSGEYVSWENLTSLVSPLNRACRNNVGVVLASCNGYAITDWVRIKAPSPYHFLLAPHSEVSAGELRVVLTAFYKEIIQLCNLNLAMAQLPQHYQRFLCTEWFYASFARFMKKNLYGKAKSTLTEDVLDAAVLRHGSQHITALRRAVKTQIKGLEGVFVSSAEVFLMQDAPVDYVQLEAFVEGLCD